MMRTLLVGATLLASLYFSIWFLTGPLDGPVDFRVFWKAARAPLGELYAPGDMPFIYPPSALFLFKPFGLVPPMPAYFLWTALSMTLFGLAVLRLSGLKVAVASFIPMASHKGIILGQSTLLLGAVLLAGVRASPMVMGAAFGMVAAIKPQIVLFAPLVFAVRREWRQLGAMAATSAAVVLASMLVFGPFLWVDWFTAIPDFQRTVSANVVAITITPAGQAETFGNSPTTALLLGAFLGVAAVVRAGRYAEKEMLVALIVAASLAAAPYAHVHDTIALLPACFVLMLRGSWGLAAPAAVIFLGVFYLIPLALVLLLAIIAIRPRLLAEVPIRS